MGSPRSGGQSFPLSRYGFCLHGAGRVRYQNSVVLNTLSKVERFQNDTVSRSYKRRNRIDLKTVWSEIGWLAK